MFVARFAKAAGRGALALTCFSAAAAGQLPTAPKPTASGAASSPTPATDPSSAAKPPSAEEQFFFRAANGERRARGLPVYKWSESLAAAARQHASRMAAADELSHQLPGEPPLDERAAQAGARFSSVGENVAIGTDTPGIEDGWMQSPGHRENTLRPQFTALGVGVVRSKGSFYAVEDFSTAVEDLTTGQQEEKVTSLLTARGFHVLGDRGQARKYCGTDYTATHRSAIAILRLETPNLNTISGEVDRRLRGVEYRTAEVGACPATKSERGMPLFRLVILLFANAEDALP